MAEGARLNAESALREDGSTFVGLPGPGDVSKHEPGPAVLPMYTEVLKLESLPGPEAIPVHFAYEAKHPNFEFDRDMTVPAAGAARFQAAYRLTDLSGHRILLNAVLPQGWEDAPMYQGFVRQIVNCVVNCVKQSHPGWYSSGGVVNTCAGLPCGRCPFFWTVPSRRWNH